MWHKSPSQSLPSFPSWDAWVDPGTENSVVPDEETAGITFGGLIVYHIVFNFLKSFPLKEWASPQRPRTIPKVKLDKAYLNREKVLRKSTYYARCACITCEATVQLVDESCCHTVQSPVLGAETHLLPGRTLLLRRRGKYKAATY